MTGPSKRSTSLRSQRPAVWKVMPTWRAKSTWDITRSLFHPRHRFLERAQFLRVEHIGAVDMMGLNPAILGHLQEIGFGDLQKFRGVCEGDNLDFLWMMISCFTSQANAPQDTDQNRQS